MIKIKICKQANEEHKASIRQYAHTGHYKNVICVANAIVDLPMNYMIAIILHEIGHLKSGGGEIQANNWVLRKCGIRIMYKDSEYGNNLEYISNDEVYEGYVIASEYCDLAALLPAC